MGTEVVKESEQKKKRYHGVVRYWRGSFGWVASKEVADLYPDCDVFLHKTDCDAAPKRFENVSFDLSFDDRGNPKAVDARLESSCPPSSPKASTVSARDCFRLRDARNSA